MALRQRTSNCLNSINHISVCGKQGFMNVLRTLLSLRSAQITSESTWDAWQLYNPKSYMQSEHCWQQRRSVLCNYREMDEYLCHALRLPDTVHLWNVKELCCAGPVHEILHQLERNRWQLQQNICETVTHCIMMMGLCTCNWQLSGNAT